jgi:hypothetical protein
MKLKLVVIDFELSARAKRIAAAVVVPLLVLGGGAVAYANVPITWTDGDTLTAADLNLNFNGLDTDIAALDQRVVTVEQAAPSVASAISALQAPVSARYRLVTTQPLPGEAYPSLGMAINYDAKDYDTANAVTTGANWQFKAPVDGKYLATASLAGNCSTCDSGAFATMRFSINETWNFAEPPIDQRYDWVGGNMMLTGSDVLVLKANDTVSVKFTENLVGSTFNAGGGAVTFTRISD